METPVISITITKKLGNLYRTLTDREVNRTNRIGMPMVFVFADVSMDLTREWQYYFCAINPGMDPKYISALLESKVAFTNSGNGTDVCRNYITGENMGVDKLPKFDKVRTCGDSTPEMIGNVVTMMDGTKPPALKPGYSQPATLAEATLGKYLFTPQGNPNLFFACVATGSDLNPNPLPHGALYPWYKNGRTPVTFLPHVSPVSITYPPARVTENTPTLAAL